MCRRLFGELVQVRSVPMIGVAIGVRGEGHFVHWMEPIPLSELSESYIPSRKNV